MKARLSNLGQAAACAALLTLSVACAKAPNDAKVVSDVQGKLAGDSGLQNKQLTVQSSNGIVTLSGTVDNDAQRTAAAKYAGSEPGVKTVVNNLQVAGAGPRDELARFSSNPDHSFVRASAGAICAKILSRAPAEGTLRTAGNRAN